MSLSIIFNVMHFGHALKHFSLNIVSNSKIFKAPSSKIANMRITVG